MKIAIGSDHGGFILKEEIKAHLLKSGHCVTDMGTHDETSVDYPEYGEKVALEVIKGEVERGIVICGTGIGISLAANKVKGIRCAPVSDVYSAMMCRKHNNCQMIALGGRTIGPELAFLLVDTFLKTEFEGGRHLRRINAVMEIENKKFE